MCAIVDKASYVLLRHLGQLFLEDAFQPSKYDIALAGIVIVNHSELNVAMTLFDNGRLSNPVALEIRAPRVGSLLALSGNGTMFSNFFSGAGERVCSLLRRLLLTEASSGSSAALRLVSDQKLVYIEEIRATAHGLRASSPS